MKDANTHQTWFRFGFSGPAAVDDITADDLHIDETFQLLDRTATTPGASVFYEYLRNPCADRASLNRRLSLHRQLAEKPAARAKILKRLQKLGPQRQGDLAREILDAPPPVFGRFRLLFFGWLFAAALLLLMCAFVGKAAVFVFIGVSVVNLAIFGKTHLRICAESGSFGYLCAMLAAAKTVLARTRRYGLENQPDLYEFRTLFLRLRGISRFSPLFRQGSGLLNDLAGLVIDYVRIFLGGELLAYYLFRSRFDSSRDNIRRFYGLFGKIDFSHSLAKTLADHTDLRSSDIADDRKDIEAEGMLHPLVEFCVPNSLRMTRGLIVTGTNMAGKSTFLRGLGLAQLLSAAVGHAFAEEFHTGFYRVMTSIGIRDDLLNGRSRYLAEAERLVSIIRRAESGEKLLTVVDEILTGTNSTDRISASVNILRHIAGHNTMVAAATHDLEIPETLSGEFDMVHFAEEIDGNDFRFDYRLKPGIVDARNAKRILKLLGFSDSLLGNE